MQSQVFSGILVSGTTIVDIQRCLACVYIDDKDVEITGL